MSWVNAGEVYYRMHRSHGPAHADRTLDTLRHSLRLDNADPDRVVHAASIKAVHRMSYADAFACATAIAARDFTLGNVLPRGNVAKDARGLKMQIWY